VRSLLFLLLRLTGLPLLLRQLAQRRCVSILCYHDPSVETLERHLQVLTRLYNVIPLQRYLEWRRRPETALPPKALIITFDDGHRNNYALRDVLQRYGVMPTVFLCSGIVGTNRRYWWSIVTPEEGGALKQIPDNERQAALRNKGYADTHEYAQRQGLSKQEIEELRPVMDFQSHTRFHPILPQCDERRARDEIFGSKTDLEQRFGLTINAFAYPNGDYSARDAELARQAGYACALTIDGGFNIATTNLYRLRRIPMADNAGRHELIVKASGLWELAKQWVTQNVGGHETRPAVAKGVAGVSNTNIELR
jgi:poly-beta-1,6-N-acetyl-D-glucosamine N-deacetylase